MAETGLIAKVETAFPGKITESYSQHGNEIIVIQREDAFAIFSALRDDPQFAFDLLVDLTAVDFLGQEPRFEVVYHLHSMRLNHRLRVKIRVPEDDAVVPSISSLWKAANWLEREVWDLFGIRFTGHPDLRRILMYEEFRGHPLRKDYPVTKRQPLVPERDPINNPWPKR
ncbi:MAG TPA: NADH-quinone oxidoreductase subunit C [Candidatus Binatia bacterium]|jgi:NADH-quinone oxidoreductase subunit C|nr:NADH-quinone oxidoreductase subunit C [Candidatus Binatia bacterium]